MALIVTRPADEADRWVQRLRARGADAVALPLLAIGPPVDLAPVAQAALSLQHWQAVMFVSANAVTGFFAFRGGMEWPQEVRAWAPGPGTQEALVRAGVPASQVDAPAPDAVQFDSESLWDQVGGQVAAGGRVLIVRGSDATGQGMGREWLGRKLAEQGVQVDAIAAYARVAPDWSLEQLAAAREAAADGSWWLFSSSEAVAHLGRLLPGEDWSAALALVTHPRIAHAARQLGFGTVREARPSLDELLASIESA